MHLTADEEEQASSEEDYSDLDPKAWVKVLEDAYLICKNSSYNNPNERKLSEGTRRAGMSLSLCTGPLSSRWLDKLNSTQQHWLS